MHLVEATILLRALLLPGGIAIALYTAAHVRRHDDVSVLAAAVICVSAVILLTGLAADLWFDRRASAGQVGAGVILGLLTAALRLSTRPGLTPPPLSLHDGMRVSSR